MAVQQKRFGIFAPEDGFMWLKYGEKTLSKNLRTRAYFRCSRSKDLNCAARKFIDVVTHDPLSETPRVTYHEEHNHPREINVPSEKLGGVPLSAASISPDKEAGTSAAAAAAATMAGESTQKDPHTASGSGRGTGAPSRDMNAGRCPEGPGSTHVKSSPPWKGFNATNSNASDFSPKEDEFVRTQLVKTEECILPSSQDRDNGGIAYGVGHLLSPLASKKEESWDGAQASFFLEGLAVTPFASPNPAILKQEQGGVSGVPLWHHSVEQGPLSDGVGRLHGGHGEHRQSSRKKLKPIQGSPVSVREGELGLIEVVYDNDEGWDDTQGGAKNSILRP